MADKNPLLEALPPATDYLTYLTVVEYNLTLENLPTLHQVLRDTKLTTNIGWDLVHLLLPLLPASEQCLQDIARLGNPRECILKVTESLRLIEFEGLDLERESDAVPPGASTDVHHASHPIKTAAVEAPVVTQAVEVPPPLPLSVNQFTSLLSMLSILHPRIKTRYPSRFLATTLQAVLAAFSHSVSHREELVSAVVRFVKDIGGPKRPHLPPRKSSATLSSILRDGRAPDPEADTGAEPPSASESDIQARLLQSFITHVLEEYMLALTSSQDVPGLAWCVRLQEKLHPERTIPGKTTMTKQFESDESLHARLTTVGELLALARDMNLSTQELLAAAETAENSGPLLPSIEEDEPPKSASDIPLSKAGSLLLFTARAVVRTLYTNRESQSDLAIFPDHQKLLKDFVSEPAGSSGATVGMEAEAVLDALLALAVLAIEDDRVGEPVDDEQFNQYLQVLALVSSNAPSPILRYHAYYVTTTILRSNPSDMARLAFIRDTLEHCPFDNLKVAAVSWIKGETIEANPSTLQTTRTSISGSDDRSSSVFGTSVALDTLAPFLFPDLTHDLSAAEVASSWLIFEQNLHFYLASLNFYYLLLSATHLHKALNIPGLHTNNDVAGSFLHPLRVASQRYKAEVEAGGELAAKWNEDGSTAANLAELQLIDATLEKVTQAVSRLNQC